MAARKLSSSKSAKRIKKPSSGTTIAVHLPADLRARIDVAAAKSGLSKQDYYRLCLEIGMIFWDEAVLIGNCFLGNGEEIRAI